MAMVVYMHVFESLKRQWIQFLIFKGLRSPCCIFKIDSFLGIQPNVILIPYQVATHQPEHCNYTWMLEQRPRPTAVVYSNLRQPHHGHNGQTSSTDSLSKGGQQIVMLLQISSVCQHIGSWCGSTLHAFFNRMYLGCLKVFILFEEKYKEDRKTECSQSESTGELTMSRFVKHYSTVIVGFQLQNQE